MKFLDSLIASSLAGFATAAKWGYDTQPWTAGACDPKGEVRQSPIDIVTANIETNENVAMDTLIGAQGFVQDHFKEASYAVKLNHLDDANTHSITFNFNSEIGNSQFKCPQFHCHFVDSEHSVNGVKTFGECHTVCYDDAKYHNFTNAIKTTNGDELAVFGFFIEEDDELTTDNAAVKTWIDAKNKFNAATYKTDVHNVKMAVPKDLSKYYRYMGGLTTPECNPIVQWTVFADTVKISSDQKLEILKWKSGHLIGNNRGVMPMQGRKVTCYGCSGAASMAASLMIVLAYFLN